MSKPTAHRRFWSWLVAGQPTPAEQKLEALRQAASEECIGKEKVYRNVQFSADVLRAAVSAFDAVVPEELRPKIDKRFSVTIADEEWSHRTYEEFFADYRRDPTHASLNLWAPGGVKLLVHVMNETTCRVDVWAATRAEIESVFEPFEANLSQATVPPRAEPVSPPTIFIGHGPNPMWRDLKDHLHEQHRYDVEAYEIGARAGHAIRDILEDMLKKSSFALLVLAAEDQDAQRKWHARDNVIHELGLFQGKLGFGRAIVLLEQGTEEFSNIHGIHQLRFSAGNIREIFGDVLATLRREFGPGAG